MTKNKLLVIVDKAVTENIRNLDTLTRSMPADDRAQIYITVETLLKSAWNLMETSFWMEGTNGFGMLFKFVEGFQEQWGNLPQPLKKDPDIASGAGTALLDLNPTVRENLLDAVDRIMDWGAREYYLGLPTPLAQETYVDGLATALRMAYTSQYAVPDGDEDDDLYLEIIDLFERQFK